MGVKVIKNQLVKDIEKGKIILENQVIESESIFGQRSEGLTIDKDNSM